jgi:hypothetical protein
MKMCKLSVFTLLAVFLLAACNVISAAGATVEPGQFLGFFTYTQPRIPLAEQATRVERRLQENPYLKGLAIRVPWKEVEPQAGRFDWSAADRMIAIAHQRHIYYTLDPLAGVMAPDWIYGMGAKRFDSVDTNPHHPTYGQTRSQPVPWDANYHRLYRNFLSRLAERYGNDPSLLEVSINGHNTTSEMHMPHTPPDTERWRQVGWSPALVEADWKSWIDFFARTFPNTHIGLVLSPMYGASTNGVVEELASYAVSSYANRLILTTHVLDGRRDQSYTFQMHIVLEYPQVPNAHETVSSFIRDPQRQGNIQMFVYNMRQTSPVFVRLWPQDAQNVQLCSKLLAEYQRARSMALVSYRSELESKGLYTTVDSYQAAAGNAGGHQHGGKFGGRRRRWMSLMGNSAPFMPNSQGDSGAGGNYQPQPGATYPEQNAYPPSSDSPASEDDLSE